MNGAIGNAFIMNLVITFIIIFFMLLIGSVAYSKSYKVNKFLMDTLMDYVDDFNVENNQKNICFDSSNDCVCKNGYCITSWRDRVNPYLSRAGYILSDTAGTCPSETKRAIDEVEGTYKVYPKDDGYILKKNTTAGDYEYCIYRKRYYELSKLDDDMTKQKYSYLVLSYMKFDFPIIGQFLKLPIISESKAVVNFH